jgi:hypothetical protein
MSYHFRGVLRARIGPGLTEPIADATVKFFFLPRTQGAVPPAEGAFAVLTPDEERDKDHLLFAQSRTDDRGAFEIDLAEQSLLLPRSPRAYSGEDFSLDILCRQVPGGATDPLDPVQVTLGLVRPNWHRREEASRAEYERVLTQGEWGQVRARFDAWVIAGRVISRDGGAPQPRLRVSAYDADLMQDDLIGSAETDERGFFRIDYAGRRFRGTPIPFVNYETGGPDLYFRVEGAGGAPLLDEKAARAVRQARGPVGACFFTELAVEPQIPIVPPAAT